MTGLPPALAPIPGPLVETGAVVARECDVEIPAGEAFGDGDGDGDGDGETVGEGDGNVSTGLDGAAGATVFVFSVAADVLRASRLTP